MKEIPLIPVESSQLEAVGHDGESNTLAIQFKSKTGPGSTYHYSNVPPKVFEGLLGAESAGKFFGEHIKPHKEKYPFVKLPKKETEGAS